MSEKLLLLAELAHSFAFETQGRCEDNPDYDGAFEKKFAELIIAECARLVDEKTNDTGCGVAASWCEGIDIYKHFE